MAEVAEVAEMAVAGEEFNTLPAAERDLRWGRIRDAMAERGVDCLLLNGTSARWNEMNANIRYVSNYADPISGNNYLLFPATGDATLISQMMQKRSKSAVSWVDDVRNLSTMKIAEIVEERLTELGLTRGRLGLVSMIFRDSEDIGIPWNRLDEIKQRLPNLEIIDVSDMFFELRSVKSAAELACIEASAKLVEVGVEAHRSGYRLGMTEREYYAALVQSMDAAGAEPPSFMLLESGPISDRWLTQDPIPSNRVLQPGDHIVTETSPKWAGYQAQGLQCVYLGTPTPEMRELVKYGAEIWHTCTDLIRPGNTFDQVVHAADPIIDKARAKLGHWSETLTPACSYAGLGGPEVTARPPEIIQPNQAFMPEIGPLGGRAGPPPPWRMNGGYCVLSTDGAPRHLNEKYSIEDMLLIDID